MQGFARCCATVAAAVVLAGCESTSLIGANQEFVSLVERSEQAKALQATGEVDETNYALTMDALRQSFDANGRAAEAMAARTPDQNTRASFLNVAVRSYLKSGPLGEGKVPGLAEAGWQTCQSGSPPVMTMLPTTCAYFLVVTPQAVQNAQVRELAELRSRIRAARSSGGAPVEDARALENLFVSLIRQVETLDERAASGAFSNANPRFLEAVYRQQDIMYCNADDARLAVLDMPESGEGWSRAEVEAGMKRDLDRVKGKLDAREGRGVPNCSQL
jgi:hypothetical protein